MSLTISAKNSILDIWHGSEYPSVNKDKAEMRWLVNLMCSHKKSLTFICKGAFLSKSKCYRNDCKIFARFEI